jgi:hypothetical protein
MFGSKSISISTRTRSTTEFAFFGTKTGRRRSVPVNTNRSSKIKNGGRNWCEFFDNCSLFFDN